MTPAYIDSHAHLGDERFDDDRDQVLLRARQAGISELLIIGYDADSSRLAIDIARGIPDGGNELSPALFATAGIAPHHVDEADAGARDRIEAMLAEPRVVAVGEIGLDYHYDMPRAAQRDLFGEQIGWALGHDLPVVVHSREAEADLVGILRDFPGLRGVVHCFTESARMAEQVVELGFYVSFAGILTFKNAADLRETAARVPLDRTLIETDSPYLAPVPHRGRRNEPAYVVEVARALAEIHDRAAEEIAATTAGNARRLFRL